MERCKTFSTLGNLLIVLALTLGGLASGNGNWQHFAVTSSASLPFSKLFGPAMIAVIFTYSGWFVSAYVGGEIKKPERTLPLSLLLGTMIVTLLYTVTNLTYLYALPLSRLKEVVNVAQLQRKPFSSPSLHSFSHYLLSWPLRPASMQRSSQEHASIMQWLRIRFFWSPFKRLHPEYNTPHLSILSQMILACLFVFLGTFDQLFSYVVFRHVTIFHRSRYWPILYYGCEDPDLPRPYQTWGYPIVPLVFICFYIWIAIQVAYSKPLTSVAGLIITTFWIAFLYLV